MQSTIISLKANMNDAQADAAVGTCDAGSNGTAVGTMTFNSVMNILTRNVSYYGLSCVVTFVVCD